MRSFRSKPVGWRGESHRHYLAAKGISTYNAPKAIGQRLQRTFELSDARRARAVSQGAEPEARKLAAEIQASRRPLSVEEEDRRKSLVKALSGASETNLALAQFWTSRIGDAFFSDAQAEVEIARERRESALQALQNATDAADLEKLQKEHEDAGRQVKLAQERLKEATYVKTKSRQVEEGTSELDTRLRQAQGKQVREYRKRERRFDDEEEM